MKVALVEWNWTGGHNATFYAQFVMALQALGCDVLALTTEPEAAREGLEAARRQGLPRESRGAVEFARIPRARRVPLPSREWRRLWYGAMRFMQVERMARRASAQLVFYASIYDRDFAPIRFVRRSLSVPWSGLYVHAPWFRRPRAANAADPRRLFDDARLSAVGMLDEGVREQAEHLLGRRVVVFPEVTDERNADTAEARELRRFARGRPLVGLFGHLHRGKGLATLAHAAARAPELCFAVGGEITWDFPPEERRVVETFLADDRRVWQRPGRIRDELTLNSLLGACDALFAAYVNFPNSSNMLTKAALLRKPVVVSDGYLMAERVRRHAMGEVVPDGDAHAAATALHAITRDPPAWIAAHAPDWGGYLERHSFEALKRAFAEVIATIRSPPR